MNFNEFIGLKSEEDPIWLFLLFALIYFAGFYFGLWF